MSITSWLRSKTSPHTPRPRAHPRPAPRFRPQLEPLDDRLVPSTLKVTNGLDSGKGSLRYEIAHASSTGKDTIVFASTVHTINLGSQINITTGVTIKGPGAIGLTLTTNYNFGDPWGQSTRVFEVNAAKPVVISGLTITDNGGTDQGGAILNHSTLALSGCDISDNISNAYGGGIANYGTMTLDGCTVSNDRTYSGGGIYNAGMMTVTGCTLSFDRADYGTAIYNTGTLSVGTTTFVWDDISGPYTDLGGNTFVTDRPVIGSFTASPGSVTAGSDVTLTASDITDANSNATITQLRFYAYGMGGIPFGYGTQTSPGVWTFTFSTAGMAPGTYTYYAEAVDSYGASSGYVATTIQVV